MNSGPLFYLIGSGSWYFSHGIQHVMFAWLVIIVLQQPPAMVGLAQTAMLVPTTLFMLLGGTFADRLGQKRVAVAAQCVAVAPLATLATGLFLNKLSFSLILVYAISFGTVQAFVTPARDALLYSVARGNIQRTVVKFTLVQFLSQMCGLAFAGSADYLGGVPILATQTFVLAMGAWSLSRVIQERPTNISREEPVFHDFGQSIIEGCRTVLADRAMRSVVVQNIFMGICFMGSYIVTIPLIIRDRYMGSSRELALVTFLNASGLVFTITLLLMSKRLRRPGRALVASHGIGALVLGAAGFEVSFPIFCFFLFCWGACGGVAMSMSRTIMQEFAPDSQRGRVMAFFSFSFMGAGPIGALIWGFSIEQIGSSLSLFIATSTMFAIAVLMGMKSRLWRI